MDFLIGGFSGAAATIVTNPMDVVKTRLQLQGELSASTEHRARYRGTLHAVYVIARTDGVFALQKALLPAMVFGFCLNSVRLGTYHIAEKKGWIKTDGVISLPKTIFWSSASGILGGIASNPASVLKTRMQAVAHPSIAVGRQHVYNGMIDGFIKIYKLEGMRGFMAGVYASCSKIAIGSAAQLTTFSTAKEILLSHGICEQSPLGLAFAASCLSGITVVLSMCPLDVIAVRLYNQGPASKGDPLYSGVMDGLMKIYKTEGFLGLYKGIGPLYLRIAPHTTVSLVIWDMLNKIL